MSGHNESETFLNPKKLPSIVFYKSQDNQNNQDKSLQYLKRNELLKSFDLNGKTINQENFDKVLNEFIKKTQKN